jgi:tetratricopeptide (TPR) repeat protein
MALMGRKLVLFWNHYEIPNHYHLEYVKGVAPVLRLPVGTFAVVAPLGLVGLAIALRRKRTATLLAAFGLTFMASVLPFFVTGRYRLAVAIVLLVGAGTAVDELWTMARARRWKGLGITLVAAAVLAAAVNVDTIEFGFTHMHNAVGAVLGGRGDIEGAAREFRKAVAESPDDVTSRYNLGLALLELGRPGDAAAEFEAAVRGHPGYHEAWIGLGRARATLGDTEGALVALANVVGAGPAAPPRALAEARGLAAALLAEIEESGEAGGR